MADWSHPARQSIEVVQNQQSQIDVGTPCCSMPAAQSRPKARPKACTCGLPTHCGEHLVSSYCDGISNSCVVDALNASVHVSDLSRT